MNNNIKTFKNVKGKKCNNSRTINLLIEIILIILLNIITRKDVKYESKTENVLEKRINDIIENNTYFKNHFRENILIIDDNLIKRTILECSIICKGSLSDTQDFLRDIYKYNCSIGKISKIINEFSSKARQFNQSVDLSKIKVGANDEIFQASKPVLVGVEPISNYIYLMQLEEKRDGETWHFYLETKSCEQGLKLEKSVSDAGRGLIKGIKMSFDGNCKIFADTFHIEREFLKGITSLENNAYAKIRKEYTQEKIYKRSKKNEDEYLNTLIETDIAIDNYDNCYILYEWFRENIAIGGYNYLERLENIKCITDELEKYKNENTYLKKAYDFIKNNTESLLRFVEDFYYRIHIISQDTGIDPIVFKLMWKQLIYNSYSKEYGDIEVQLYTIAKKDYHSARNLFTELIRNTIRASSIVENINSLLRPYLTLKKTPNQNFLDLLQLYFNTRKFKRSRIKDKIGKSPLEMYTNKEHPSFFEILGI